MFRSAVTEWMPAMEIVQLVFSASRQPILRPATLNDVIKRSRAMKTVSIPSTLEPVSVDRSDIRRPDGITFSFSSGKGLSCDAGGVRAAAGGRR